MGRGWVAPDLGSELLLPLNPPQANKETTDPPDPST